MKKPPDSVITSIKNSIDREPPITDEELSILSEKLYECGYYGIKSSIEIASLLGIELIRLAKLLQIKSAIASYTRGKSQAHLDTNKALMNIALSSDSPNQFSAIKYLQQARYLENDKKASDLIKQNTAKRALKSQERRSDQIVELSRAKLVMSASEAELTELIGKG